MAALAGKELAREIARLAIEKNAGNILILDLRKLSAPAEFYVIATALSSPHLRGLRDFLKISLETKGLRLLHADGMADGSEWLVLDYFDVIVHLFSKEKRRYFALEDLYSDVPMEAYGLEKKPAPAKPAPKKAKKAPAKKKKNAPRRRRS
jgi:ribosome-associated protein